MDVSFGKRLIQNRDLAGLFVLLILIFIPQGLVFYEYFLHKVGLGIAVGANLSLVLVLVFYTVYRACSGADIRDHILSCAMVFSLGAVGTVIALLMVMFHQIFSSQLKENFSEWIYQYLFALEQNEKDSDRLYQRILAGQEMLLADIDTEPLVDIMNFGALEQKQEALIKVVKYYNPDLTPILKMGLNDANNTIRVQAAAGLSRLQNNFYLHYDAEEKAIAAHPDDSELLFKFANFCDRYAGSTLLDPAHQIEVTEKSIELYERAVALAPARLEIKTALVRVLLRHNRSRAGELLTELLGDLRPDVPAALIHSVLESLYVLRRYDELLYWARRWQPDKAAGHEMAERLSVWRNPLADAGVAWTQK